MPARRVRKLVKTAPAPAAAVAPPQAPGGSGGGRPSLSQSQEYEYDSDGCGSDPEENLQRAAAKGPAKKIEKRARRARPVVAAEAAAADPTEPALLAPASAAPTAAGQAPPAAAPPPSPAVPPGGPPRKRLKLSLKMQQQRRRGSGGGEQDAPVQAAVGSAVVGRAISVADRAQPPPRRTEAGVPPRSPTEAVDAAEAIDAVEAAKVAEAAEIAAVAEAARKRVADEETAALEAAEVAEAAEEAQAAAGRKENREPKLTSWQAAAGRKENREPKLTSWSAREQRQLVALIASDGTGRWQRKADALGTGRSKGAVMMWWRKYGSVAAAAPPPPVEAAGMAWVPPVRPPLSLGRTPAAAQAGAAWQPQQPSAEALTGAVEFPTSHDWQQDHGWQPEAPPPQAASPQRAFASETRMLVAMGFAEAAASSALQAVDSRGGPRQPLSWAEAAIELIVAGPSAGEEPQGGGGPAVAAPAQAMQPRPAAAVAKPLRRNSAAAKLLQLREVLGAEPPHSRLVELLESNDSNVDRAVRAHFTQPAAELLPPPPPPPPPLPAPIQQMPPSAVAAAEARCAAAQPAQASRSPALVGAGSSPAASRRRCTQPIEITEVVPSSQTQPAAAGGAAAQEDTSAAATETTLTLRLMRPETDAAVWEAAQELQVKTRGRPWWSNPSQYHCTDATRLGVALQLVREPENVVDPNALAVQAAATGEHLGYIQAGFAGDTAPLPSVFGHRGFCFPRVGRRVDGERFWY